jgi:peptidoglycan/LPS O-acetylase OafA/YrhL
MSAIPKLSDFSGGRDNNFNLLRMIAASAVLISHAYPLAQGTGAAEPLSSVLGISLGTLAVLTFFAISGFFISQSFDRRQSFIGFCMARVLRIYPGLIAVLVLTVFVIGPVFTTMTQSAYLADVTTISYIPRNLTLKWLQYDLPGVFQNNPYPAAINGSLWTLFYEVVCYGMVVAVGALGLTARGRSFVAFLFAYLIGYLALKLTDRDNHLHFVALTIFLELSLPFVIGMAFYQFRRALPLSWIMCAGTACVALLAYGTFWFQESFVLFWCYSIFWLGYLPGKPLRAYNRLGDYSYGIYIYAFPCEQITAALWKGISPLGLMMVSLPVTLAFAVVSWHFLESRALAYRTAAAGWLERGLPLSRTG